MNKHAAPSPTIDPTETTDSMTPAAVGGPSDVARSGAAAAPNRPRRRSAMIVAGSLLAGLLAAALLVVGAFGGDSFARAIAYGLDAGASPDGC